MQQQQQHAEFDLLAVFAEESTADAAEAKLRKEGFGDEEVFRPTPGVVGSGEFREHGPNRDRSSVFLQTRRAGPSPRLVVLFALIFGVVLGGLSFGVVDLAVKSIQVLPATLIGVLIGIILGAILGLTRRGKVRGAIGQDMTKVKPAETPARRPQETAGARTVVAVRLPDPENISRKSKARAILLNNGGKIDRSVSR
ncbi:MAG TPA: hypothetical protein VN729_08425 [Ktedonobacteraceae bacterium]|nr:hypothetical protein [Ktedonobacteraceae bacterium]